MRDQTLTLGYSPCPNDTFIFHALTHGLIDTKGLRFDVRHLNVETLNQAAIKSELDISKISFGAYPNIADNYAVLRSGGAMGRGCGPLIVAKERVGLEFLRGKPIAVPGLNTTAFLLLRLLDSRLADNIKPMRFDDIMPAVLSGAVDAGLIIHEGRFTYRRYGLVELIDLGAWWESQTKLPIPLGCIVGKRALGEDKLRLIESLISQSVRYAFDNPNASRDYIKQHAQEMDDGVIENHIKLYVNDFSVDFKSEGEAAIGAMFDMAARRGLLKQTDKKPLFV